MGAYIMNGYGQRKFLSDGGFAYSAIDTAIVGAYDKTKMCTQISCDVKIANLAEAISPPDSSELPLFCQGMVHMEDFYYTPKNKLIYFL
jgi:hypothetical protein